MEQQMKCYSVHLSASQCAALEEVKEATKKSQGALLTEAVGYGLKQHSALSCGRALFLVKVRIDTDLMPLMGAKLASGELDRSNLIFTWCLEDDPAVGVNLWAADDREDFERIFAPHKAYYREVIEMQRVIPPAQSMQLLLESMKDKG